MLRSSTLDVPFDYHDVNIIFSHLNISEVIPLALALHFTHIRGFDLNAFAEGLAKLLPKTLCDGIMKKERHEIQGLPS